MLTRRGIPFGPDTLNACVQIESCFLVRLICNRWVAWLCLIRHGDLVWMGFGFLDSLDCRCRANKFQFRFFQSFRRNNVLLSAKMGVTYAIWFQTDQFVNAWSCSSCQTLKTRGTQWIHQINGSTNSTDPPNQRSRQKGPRDSKHSSRCQIYKLSAMVWACLALRIFNYSLNAGGSAQTAYRVRSGAFGVNFYRWIQVTRVCSLDPPYYLRL